MDINEVRLWLKKEIEFNKPVLDKLTHYGVAYYTKIEGRTECAEALLKKMNKDVDWFHNYLTDKEINNER